jgi:hypothetical protein
VKNSVGGGKNVPVLTAGISFLGNSIFQPEAKTSQVFCYIESSNLLFKCQFPHLKMKSEKHFSKQKLFINVHRISEPSLWFTIFASVFPTFHFALFTCWLDSPYGFFHELRKLQSRNDTYTLQT